MQVESAYNPYAKSAKGTLGLMQLMPATIQQFGVWNPYSRVENVRAGVAYLRQLLQRYQNEELALAAYNAGRSAVDRHGRNVPPLAETQNYVLRVNRMAGRPREQRVNVIYKITEAISPRLVARYSDHKPVTGLYEVAGSR